MFTVTLKEFVEMIEGELTLLTEVRVKTWIIVHECGESVAGDQLYGDIARLHPIDEVQVGEIERVFNDARTLSIA